MPDASQATTSLTPVIAAGSLTGFVTIVASFGTVILTHRFQFKRWQAERGDQAKADQRKHVAEVLAVGREWCTRWEGMTLAAGVRGLNQIEFVNSDGFKAFVEYNKQYERALAVAWVSVSQPAVAEVLDQLRRLKRMSDDYTGQIFSAMKQVSDPVPALGRAHGFAERYAQELQRLAEVTLASLR